MKQAYLTIPLMLAYWVFIPTESMDSDTMSGYIIIGVMLTIGSLSDLGKVKE